ncbi:MAG: hypothetical protein JO360_05220 [Acidobacteria bacterium]|nr:hypothetical protein [Acidobacteriota bacterium]
MRKFAFGLLLLSVVLALACASSTTDTPGTRGDKDDRWVSIIVYRDKDDKLHAELRPKLIRITHKRHKIHFILYNDLDEGEDVQTVDIDFGANAPFDDNLKKFTINNVASGFSGEAVMKKAKEVANTTTYDYTVNIKTTRESIVADPQVEISGGRVNLQPSPPTK